MSVKVDKAVALAETGQHAIAVRTPVVEPGALADRRNRPLQRIIEVGVLPERPLPGIREGRRTVELFALEANIGDEVFLARIADCFRLPFFKLARDRGHAPARTFLVTG